jgi:hypothetical protein
MTIATGPGTQRESGQLEYWDLGQHQSNQPTHELGESCDRPVLMNA